MRNLYKITILCISLLFIGCGKRTVSKEQIDNPKEYNTFPVEDEFLSFLDQPTSEAVNIYSDSSIPEPSWNTELFPAFEIIDNNRKYGYIDQTGTFIIPPQYDTASFFHNSLAVVSIDGIYQIINIDGAVLFENNGLIREYKNGMAVFSQQSESTNQYGYLNLNCEIIVPPIYLNATDFEENNLAIVTTDLQSYHIIDSSGKIIKLLDGVIASTNIHSIRDGYWVYTDSNSHLQGVKNMEGHIIIEPIYPLIYNLGNGLFAMNNSEDGLAIFNDKGLQLTDYIYYEVDIFQGAYASATDDSTTFFIDTNGQPIYDLPIVDGIGSLRYFGNVIQAMVDKELFYLTSDGDLIWKADYSEQIDQNITVVPYKYRTNRFTLIYYPQIEGLKDEAVQLEINQKIQSLFARTLETNLPDLTTYINDNFEIDLQKNLMTIQKHGYDYTEETSHGMPIWNYYYFDIQTGKNYVLKDLFIGDSLYISKLNQLLEKQIKNNASSPDKLSLIKSFTGISENPYFILGKDDLTIYFYPADGSTYNGGFKKFDIPYQELWDMINTEGELWNSFQHGKLSIKEQQPNESNNEIFTTLIKYYEKSLTNYTNQFDALEHFLVKESNYYKSIKKSLSNGDLNSLDFISCTVTAIKPLHRDGNFDVYADVVTTSYQIDGTSTTDTTKYIYSIWAVPSKNCYQIFNKKILN